MKKPTQRCLTLTQANLDHGHIYLTDCMDMFPEDAVGGANKSQAAPRTVRVQYGSKAVVTDIDREKRVFRRRGWVRRFFSESRLVAGDRVLLEQIAPYSYRVSNAAYMRLACLSIQQPFADLILDGKKRVENRTEKRRSGLWNGQESGLLGIHASSSQAIWRRYTEEERKHYAPGWCPSDDPGLSHVLGIVDVVQICKPKNLPPGLCGDKFVDESIAWCYVFKNPRKLAVPLKARGRSALFNVDIPRHLLPDDLR